MFNRLFNAINTVVLPFIGQLGLHLKTVMTDSLKSDPYRISSEPVCQCFVYACVEGFMLLWNFPIS